MTLTLDPLRTLTVDPQMLRPGGRFRILRPHARGGLGEVFVAHDEELPREVALKEIQLDYAHDAASRERFIREAEITGGLEHPGIVPVYALGVYADGRPFYAMRFIRGETLKDSIARFHAADRPAQDLGVRSVELRRLLGRLVAVCQAIEYAHSRGVLHRDLKPSNVMVGKYGETLVVDWGLAKAAGREDVPASTTIEPVLTPRSGSSSEPTAMGKALGTPAYMSPEQAAGRIDMLGARSDVYSLGATMYEMLTGEPPISGQTIGEMLQRVERGEFLRPREVNPRVPRCLEAICLKALAREPAGRYESAAALASDIERWLADEPIAAHRDRLAERVDRWLRRYRAWATAAALTIFLVAVASSAALAIVHQAHDDVQRERDLAHRAIDRYEEVGQRLMHLAQQPEQAPLRESREYRELIEQLTHTQAAFPASE